MQKCLLYKIKSKTGFMYWPDFYCILLDFLCVFFLLSFPSKNQKPGQAMGKEIHNVCCVYFFHHYF